MLKRRRKAGAASAAFVDEIREIAGNLGLTLGAADLEGYAMVVANRLAGYARLDELTTGGAPYRREKLGWPPHADENPHDAWVWRCEIPGRRGGPLNGQTVAVKDNICVAGTPTSFGSRLMQGYIASENAPVVERVLDAGATVVGKTAMTDLGNDGAGVTGYPEPRPDNPWRHGYLPGGSSSGSAVVVAVGEADLAIGNDGGGSIREPASWSGCCGLKPTHGLVPAAGGLPFEPRLTDVGPLSRTVDGCARLLTAVADGRTDYAAALSEGLEGVEVGLLAEGFGIPGRSEPDVDESVRASVDVLASLGAVVRDVSVPMHSDAIAIWTGIAVEGATDLLVRNALAQPEPGRLGIGPLAFFAEAVRRRPSDLPPTWLAAFMLGEYLLRDNARRRLAIAHELGASLRAAYDRVLRDCEVLIMPTTPAKSQPRPSPDGELESFLNLAAGSYENTAPFNVTGHPALSVPCGFHSGLPIGMMIVGRHMEDDIVLRVGHGYQAASGLPTMAATDSTGNERNGRT